MHDLPTSDPDETSSPRTEGSDPVVDEGLSAAEADLDAVEAALGAIDRDDLDAAEEMVTGLDSGGNDPD